MGEGGCDSGELGDVKNCGGCGRECVKDGGVLEPRCVEGRCTSECDSGFVNITRPPAPALDDGCEAPGRRVFVTNTLYAVEDFGSVDGADALCQSLAEDHELGGAWRAWISAPEDAVAQRFNHLPAAPYLLLNGEQVAASWQALTSTGDQSSLDHAIDRTELGTTVQGGAFNGVWTGTRPNGAVSDWHCGNWAADNQTALGSVGVCSQTSSAWSMDLSPIGCAGLEARLYCFEQ
jgi:hypothetical protein